MKAVLLNSGGIDSRVAAAIGKKAGWELLSVYIDCNPYNRDRVLPAVQRTADLYCVEHEVIPFPYNMMLAKPRMTPGIGYSSLFMHVIGLSYAKFKDLTAIVSGSKNDVWHADWKNQLQEIIASNKERTPVILYMPVAELVRMEDVVAKAQELGVPLEDTVSCGSATPPCDCPKCQIRARLGLPIL